MSPATSQTPKSVTPGVLKKIAKCGTGTVSCPRQSELGVDTWAKALCIAMAKLGLANQSMFHA